MRVIYIDTLFVLNLAVDYFLLLLTATISGVYQKRRRLFLGAVAGAFLATAGYFLTTGAIFAMAFRVFSCILIVWLAFGTQKRNILIRLCGAFLLLTVLLAGVIYGISSLNGVPLLQNGIPYMEISVPFMLVAFLLIYLLSGVVLGKGRAAAGRCYQTVTAVMGEEKITFRALADSGNLLRDPISGQRVIVASNSTLSGLFRGAGAMILKNMDDWPAEELLPRLRKCCKTSFWILPVHTAAQKGFILVFRPEELYIDGRKTDEYLLGVTTQTLEIGNDCCALIGV